jgi:chemotaxis protein MotB
LTVAKNEIEGESLAYQKKYYELEKQIIGLENQLDELKYKNQQLSKNGKELEKQIELLKTGSSDEISKLLDELQILQNDLQDREDKVRKAEDILMTQHQKLKQAQQELKEQEEKLKETEAALKEEQLRMMELQDALDKQKEAVTSLKNKLIHSLRGFYDQGLSVYEKNGKVYVSLEEQLIFKTGSYNLDPKGQEALKSLSEVLANNPDINIMVEGHTDDVPLNGAGTIKDNWDLSVMRATAVAKIILNNSNINPKRITASGRGEFVPLEEGKTAEVRTKNRRTEIILTPDLSEVLEILQSN